MRSRRTVLFANELGGGRGHVARLAAVASRTREFGSRNVLALPRRRCSSSLAAAFDEFVSLPVGPPSNDATRNRTLIGQAGLLDAADVEHRMEAATDILAQAKPDFIVTDYAPFTTAAAAGDFRILAIGSGFTIPPTGSVPPGNWVSGTEVFPTVIERALGRMDSGRPTDLFRGDQTLVCCWREFDPYDALRQPSEERVGPLADVPYPKPASETDGQRAYAYLHNPTRNALNLYAFFCDSGWGVDIAWNRRLPPTELPACVSILPTLLDHDAICTGYDLVIHGGGLGLSSLCLAAAKPQILLPSHAEARGNAHTVAALGGGVIINPKRPLTGGQFGEALKLVMDTDFRAQLFQTGRRLAERGHRSTWRDNVDAALMKTADLDC